MVLGREIIQVRKCLDEQRYERSIVMKILWELFSFKTKTIHMPEDAHRSAQTWNG
jgi:hypothetical protein